MPAHRDVAQQRTRVFSTLITYSWEVGAFSAKLMRCWGTLTVQRPSFVNTGADGGSSHQQAAGFLCTASCWRRFLQLGCVKLGRTRSSPEVSKFCRWRWYTNNDVGNYLEFVQNEINWNIYYFMFCRSDFRPGKLS